MSERQLIITAADAGLGVSVNAAIADAFKAGVISDASLLVVAPFSREAVRRIGPHLGIQLALSAEHELLEMRPITHAPSLLGGRGGFPLDAEDAAEHADPDEVHREFRAQIERARLLGVEPTFLASHDDVVARHLALFDVFLDVAEEYQLPIRHGYKFSGSPLNAAELARARGHFVAASTINWDGSQDLEETVATLPNGTSEIIVHISRPSEDLAAVVDDASRRSATFDALMAQLSPQLLSHHAVNLTSWAQISKNS